MCISCYLLPKLVSSLEITNENVINEELEILRRGIKGLNQETEERCSGGLEGQRREGEGRGDLKGRRHRKRSWWRGGREGEFSEARGHVNLGKM